MATRVLAFLAALGMVAAAFAVRGAMDRDGSDGGGDGGDEFVLVCASELGDLCSEADATKREAANVTADHLIGLSRDEDPELDAWLVPGPWPQMVDEVRELAQEQPIFEKKETLGWSRLVVVSREGGIDETCASAWTCVADGAVDGSHTVGASSTRDAMGVLARAAALSARVDSTDYGNEVFDEQGGWLTTLSTALDRSQFGAATLQRFLTTPGSAEAFIATRAAANDTGLSGVAIPDPGVEVALSLGLVKGASKPDRLDDVARERGWSPPETVAPVDDGLPSPDVLYALRDFL